MSDATTPSPESEPRKPGEQTVDRILREGDPSVIKSMNESQYGELRRLLLAAIVGTAPKLVDLRFHVPLLFTRLYVVLMLGKDRRQVRRPFRAAPGARFGNLVATAYLLLTIILPIAAVVSIACMPDLEDIEETEVATDTQTDDGETAVEKRHLRVGAGADRNVQVGETVTFEVDVIWSGRRAVLEHEWDFGDGNMGGGGSWSLTRTRVPESLW